MILKSNVLSKQASELQEYLRSTVIGQDEAIRETVLVTQKHFAGLSQERRPICTFLFIGPTGTGKTKLVEEFFDYLTSHNKSIKPIKINCGEFQGSHEITKLIGAPPAYLGHNETKAVFNKEAVEAVVPNVILFDEIEKASDAMFNILLGVLDKGEIKLGNNTFVDLSNCFIFMTSNEGMEKIQKEEKTMGFLKASVDEKMGKIIDGNLKQKFRPEFLNRIDRVIKFNYLSEEDIIKILDLEIFQIQDRILKSCRKKIFITLDEESKKFLTKAGYCKEYGARNIKRILEKEIVMPLSNIILSSDIDSGDIVYITLNDTQTELVFDKINTKDTSTKSRMLTIPL